MQEHHQEPNHQTQFPISDAHLNLNPQADAVAIETRLDAYLDAVCADLPPETPVNAVQEMRHEMRGHLQVAVIAMQELNYSPEQAVEHALAQFGKPQVVARQWQEEWETTLVEAKAISFWPSLKVALKVWAVVDIAALAVFALIVAITLQRHQEALLSVLRLMLFCVPPLVAGAIIGLRTRRNPVACTLAAYALLLPLLLIGFIGINACQGPYVNWLTSKTYSQYSDPIGFYIRAGIQGALSFLPLWTILSVFSSGTVTLARRFKTRRRQIAR